MARILGRIEEHDVTYPETTGPTAPDGGTGGSTPNSNGTSRGATAGNSTTNKVQTCADVDPRNIDEPPSHTTDYDSVCHDECTCQPPGSSPAPSALTRQTGGVIQRTTNLHLCSISQHIE